MPAWKCVHPASGKTMIIVIVYIPAIMERQNLVSNLFLTMRIWYFDMYLVCVDFFFQVDAQLYTAGAIIT